MSTYELQMPEVGVVKVSKKRGQTSLRIRLSSKGDVFVSAPWSLPKIAIERYLVTKKDWILENRPDYDLDIVDGLKFGQNLELKIIENAKTNRSKISSNVLNVCIRSKLNINDDKQKKYIETKMINAMKLEAEIILLPKLNEIANRTEHSFNQAYVKNLKSRWGSCDKDKNIILNIFLLQLPEELQEYVIIHELTHTIHLNHSKNFWQHVQTYLPNYKQLRKELHVHHPRIEERM